MKWIKGKGSIFKASKVLLSFFFFPLCDFIFHFMKRKAKATACIKKSTSHRPFSSATFRNAVTFEPSQNDNTAPYITFSHNNWIHSVRVENSGSKPVFMLNWVLAKWGFWRVFSSTEPLKWYWIWISDPPLTGWFPQSNNYGVACLLVVKGRIERHI